MATSKNTEPKKPVAEVRRENENLKIELRRLKDSAYCYMCDKHKSKDEFYKSSDTRIHSGITRICKACAFNIASPFDENGNHILPTKATVMAALEYLDKPYIEKIWDSSYFESINSTQNSKQSIWHNYMKNVAMPQYKTLRWRDSDIFKKNVTIQNLNGNGDKVNGPNKIVHIDEKIQEDYLKNKKDVLSQVGYDPFENYQREDDKPFLYASLNSFIDEETKNDGMKLKAVIQIVKTYNQIEKINDTIDAYVVDSNDLLNNIASLDKLSATVDKLIRSSAKLAQDNGISINFNNNKSKGANTLSGKIKHLTEIGFKDASINAFDIGTSQGMLQVAELSEKARHEQISNYSLRIA